MDTLPCYFEDTYKFEGRATLCAVGKDESGHFIILDQTLFHPQGGGQPSDQGTLQIGETMIPIYRVKSADKTIRHYTDKNYSPFVGQEATCSLDQDLRLTHARLHTAGHLISNIVESLFPHWKSVKGHHFPNECYVEFSSHDDAPDVPSTEQLSQEIEKYIAMDCLLRTDHLTGRRVRELCPNLEFSIPLDQLVRLVRIGEFPFSLCGGTHIKNLKELKGLKVTHIKVKNGTMKVKYCLHSTDPLSR